MEKTIHHEKKPKKPIGQKHIPVKMSEYEISEAVVFRLKRMGIRDMYD